MHDAPTFARYVVLCRLGGGGMGDVWLARHTGTGALRALKTMKSELHRDARAQEMLVDEARIAAQIRHRNVATVLDAADDGGGPYLVMEWVDGPSLREIVGRLGEGERVPLSIALRIAADACAGLHAAHELRDAEGVSVGLVHRDVSPHNILLTSGGVAKLIDFGVAKARARLSGDTTSSGGIKGKVRYMAPEQALGCAIDRRADVFAMGAVLHHLVTGRAPFEGANDLAILHDLLTFKAVTLPDHVPAPVVEIIRRSLTQRREDRYPSADAMRVALEVALGTLGLVASELDVAAFVALHQGPERAAVQALFGGDAPTRRPPPSRRPPWARVGVVTAAGAAALFALVLGDAQRRSVPPAAAATARPVVAQLPATAEQPVASQPPVVAQPPVVPPPPPVVAPPVVVAPPPVAAPAPAVAAQPATVIASPRRAPARVTRAVAPTSRRGDATRRDDDLVTSLRERR